MDSTLKQLKEVSLSNIASLKFYRSAIKTQEDLDYAYDLQALLKKLDDVELRVENPWISFYTNSKKNVDKLTGLDENRVKYISVPDGIVESGTIILPKVDFEFKVTLGRTHKEHSAFVSWAENNPKVQLTKSCIKEMLRETGSFGGAYFYITGEKNLLMAKMHLGGSINKLERIVKS
jgi:hypothetical protein